VSLMQRVEVLEDRLDGEGRKEATPHAPDGGVWRGGDFGL
jgi:hypothetical protein